LGQHFDDLRSHWRVRDVRLVLSASLVNSLGTGLYLASYALFAFRSHVSGSQLSLALSIGGMVAVLAAPVGARAAETIGALRLTVLLNLGRGLATLGLVVTSAYVFGALIFALTVLDRFAFPATQTVLAAVSGRGDRSLVLSLRQLTQTLGVLAGTGIAALAQFGESNRTSLAVLVAANGISFLANAWMYSRLPSETGAPKEQPLPWHVGWPNRPVRLLLASSVILDSGGLVVSLGFPLVLVATGSTNVAWIGALVALETAIGVLAMSLVGKYVKTSRQAIGGLVIGAVTSAAACLILGVAGVTHLTALLVAAVGFGLGSTLASYAVYFFVIEEAPREHVQRHLAAYGVAGSAQRVLTPWILTGLAAAATSLLGWASLSGLLLAAGAVAAYGARTALNASRPDGTAAAARPEC